MNIKFNLTAALRALGIITIVLFIGYSIVGTSYKVNDIRKKVPEAMEARNWTILRYEGYQFGSWCNDGGKVWYHVADVDNPNIQYRVYVTMWKGELQYNYGDPIPLSRVNVNYNDIDHGRAEDN